MESVRMLVASPLTEFHMPVSTVSSFITIRAKQKLAPAQHLP